MRWLALLAAALAAAVLPYSRPGIAVPLVAAIVALAVASSARRSARLLVLGGLALALACMPASLDAPWIVATDLVAACLLATIAVAGVSVVAPAAPLRALVDVRPLLPSGGAQWIPAARGALIGSLLVVPFGALFWSADAAFAELGGSLPLPSLASAPGRVVVFLGVLVGAVGSAPSRGSRCRSGRSRSSSSTSCSWRSCSSRRQCSSEAMPTCSRRPA
jgi:hypothetical protein